eukprot:524995_1
MTELIPFMNTNDLKQDIKQILNQKLKTDDSNSIRALFIKVHSLHSIPSDIIQAKIFSFLPACDYKTLPLVSKHFRNIMHSNPFIYNQQNYQTNLKFAEEENTCQTIFEIMSFGGSAVDNIPKTIAECAKTGIPIMVACNAVNIYHCREDHAPFALFNNDVSFTTCTDLAKSFAKFKLFKNKVLPTSSSIPWNYFSSWNILLGKVNMDNISLPQNFDDEERLRKILENKHNNRLIHLLHKYNKSIRTLRIIFQYNHSNLVSKIFNG